MSSFDQETVSPTLMLSGFGIKHWFASSQPGTDVPVGSETFTVFGPVIVGTSSTLGGVTCTGEGGVSKSYTVADICRTISPKYFSVDDIVNTSAIAALMAD